MTDLRRTPRRWLLGLLTMVLAVTLMSTAHARWINFSGKTAVFNVAGGGLQVEYFSRFGKAYLWKPSNGRIIKGSWSIVNRNQMRFRFGSFQQFVFLGSLTNMTLAVCSGDPFQLSKLQKPKLSIAQMRQRCR